MHCAELSEPAMVLKAAATRVVPQQIDDSLIGERLVSVGIIAEGIQHLIHRFPVAALPAKGSQQQTGIRIIHIGRMVIPVGIKIALCFSKSHAAAAQSVEAPVEKRVCVGGIQKRRLCPQFFRIRRSSEVEEAEGVVIQGIRVVRSRLRLRPRVIFAGLLEVYFDQCRFDLAEITGTVVGHLLQALHQQFLQRVRNRMLSTHVKIVPARNACERAGGVSAVRPGLIAEIHFQHAHCPAVDIRPVCQLLMSRLLRRAISGRHASPAGSHQRRIGVSFSLRLLSFCCRQE